MKKVLFIGGTGTISTDCVRLAQEKGFDVTLLNRGNSMAPAGVHRVVCDIDDEGAVRRLPVGDYDVVADFIAYLPGQVERDIRLFSGKTSQYVFISSASAYQKPLSQCVITESTPLYNPYWQYSRNKIECERRLDCAYRESGFPVTVVRPSHTYDCRSVPVALHGKAGSWQVLKRMLDGKPVIVPGDGLNWWTLTFSADFAVGFTGLLGNPHAIGEAVHITSDEKLTWNAIYQIIGRRLGCEPALAHIACDALVKLDPGLEGPLIGDKANSVDFDNTKIKRLVPEFIAPTRFDQGVAQSIEYILAHSELQVEDSEFDAFCDKAISMW